MTRDKLQRPGTAYYQAEQEKTMHQNSIVHEVGFIDRGVYVVV